MPKTLSDNEMDDMKEIAKAFLLVSESRYLVRSAEISHKEFFEHIDDICIAYDTRTLNHEADYIMRQLEETGRAVESIEELFSK